MDDDAACLQQEWDCDPRWQGIHRPYTPEEVLKLRGTLKLEHTFAEVGAQRLWYLLQTEDYIAALGAMTGNQAVPQSLQLGERVEPKARRDRRPNLYNRHLYSAICCLSSVMCSMPSV